MSSATSARTGDGRHAYDLVVHLVSREFQLRYRRAVFGWLWAIAQPLLRFAVFAYVFTEIIPVGNIPDYPAFLFIGIVVWTWFASGVLSATNSVVVRPDLLLRPRVPRVVAPLVAVLTDMLDFLAALPIIAVFLLFSDGISIYAIGLPVLMALQLVLILGIGLALCSANVYFRDVRLFTEVALMLGFYLTPVFYPRTALPDSVAFFYDWNPVARLLSAYRAILIYHRMPDNGTVAFVAVVSAVALASGLLIYRRACKNFVDEL
jgi:lipopolysaccharide transport system permease protein